jgi:hypothetical protein
MKNCEITVDFVGDCGIEICMSAGLFLALEKRAKVRGVSVQALLSAELLRVRSVDR